MKKIIYIISVFLFYASLMFGQSSGKISGRVFDKDSKSPVEYANIIVFRSKDSVQVTGGVTSSDGNFSLTKIPVGEFYVDIQFIGYEKKRIKNVLISSAKRNVDLGNIFIKSSAVNLGNVVVQGERNPVSYQIDRRVIDVSKMPTSISGNAADVLENVPSVSVDIDGNVSLRGSSSFTVLIDGRPSVMDAQDALQQIPASSIESIEIITNPSAKYDPEGSAGIINIKLKKEKNLGLSGIANANAGANDKYGGDFLFEYKTPAYNYNFGVDYNRRFSPGTGLDQKEFNVGNDISHLNSDGSRQWGRISFGLRGGIDFNLSDKDLLSLSGRFGSREHENNMASNYIQWSDLQPQKIYYINNNNSSRNGSFFAFNTDYTRKFNDNGHQISGDFFVSHNNSDESSISSSVQRNVQTDGKKTTEAGPSTHFRGKIDYTLPLGENTKFEAGTQGESRLEDESNGLYNYNAVTDAYDFQPLYSHSNKYNRSNLAIYSIFSDQLGNLSYQAGVRTELTYRTIKLLDNNEEYSINRWDFFPSLHTSYNFGGGNQLMASYSRRINRPNGWNLEPFLSWWDPNNVRKGNPNLLPEFIDSYELGFQTLLGEITLNNDVYYRINHNRIDWVRSAYAENVTLNTFANVGTDYSLGTEYMFTLNPLKLWNVNLMGNLYDYRIKGVINDVPYEKKSFNWNIRFNNGINIFKTTQLQLNIRYNSPSVSSQGRYEGFFRTDAAVKQDLFGKNISLTLQARDLFKTGKREFTSQGADFYSYTYYTRESPMVILNVRFNFNNYKEKDSQNTNEQPNNGGPEESY
ncbi:MAG: outer membrane beta-barrel family protein [Ignavibacteriaceae bacterium]